MGDNKDGLKNYKGDVSSIGLMQIDRTSVIKLSGLDSTGRSTHWNKIKRSLKTESGSDNYSFLHTNTAIRAERLCQLPIYIAKLTGSYKNGADEQKTVTGIGTR